MIRALAVGLLAMAIVACGGDGKTSNSLNPEELQTAVIAAMADVQSYRTDMHFGDRDQALAWEYARPDSYRTFWPGQPALGGVETDASGSEAVYVGDRIYSRECQEARTTCGPWRSEARGTVIVGALSPSYFPQWPLIAFEMAQDIRDISGNGTQIRGSVNHLRAILENARRLAAAAGVSSFGQACTAHATPITIGENTAGSTPQGLDNCHDLTFAESLGQEEPELSFYDEHPATIDVVIDPTTHFIYRIELTGFTYEGDGEPSGSTPGTLIFEYSDFNNVTIEAPK